MYISHQSSFSFWLICPEYKSAIGDGWKKLPVVWESQLIKPICWSLICKASNFYISKDPHSIIIIATAY